MTYGRHIDIGGRRLYLESMGEGSPPVVFESGLECGAASLRNLAVEVQQVTRVGYDRAGVGESDPAPTPRTSLEVADDPHCMLRTAAVEPPYILVGHSIAGLHLRVYVQRYPQEVAGMVLLDVAHPDQWQRELDLVATPTADEPAALTAFRRTIAAEWGDPTANSEGLDIAASAAQARTASSLGAIPLVVITAGKDTWDEGFPSNLAAALEQDWHRLQRDLVALSPRSKHVIATESDHVIQCGQPELALSEIRGLVELVRSEMKQANSGWKTASWTWRKSQAQMSLAWFWRKMAHVSPHGRD